MQRIVGLEDVREMERQVEVFLFIRKIIFVLKDNITRQMNEQKSNTD